MTENQSDLKYFRLGIIVKAMQLWVRFPLCLLIGVVAQLAERYLCKVKDAGSTPVSSTIANTVALC